MIDTIKLQGAVHNELQIQITSRIFHVNNQVFLFRCFRDEDLRADRQPEFTQLDMELAFTPLDDMLKLNEDLIRHVLPNQHVLCLI